MQGVGRHFGKISGVVIFSLLAGAAVVLVAGWLNVMEFIVLLLSMPIAFYTLPSLVLTWSKVSRLLKQLQWWHFLWLFIFLSGQTFRVRSMEDIQENPLDPAAVYRVSLIGAVGFVLLGIFLLRRRSGIHNLFRGPVAWLTAYSFITTLSMFWSIYPIWTLYKSIEYLLSVALLAAILGHVRTVQEFKTLVDWTWIINTLLLVSVLLSMIIKPEFVFRPIQGGFGFLIQGYFPLIAHEKIGQTAAILGVVSLNRVLSYQHSKRFYLFMLVVSFSFLVVSQSRSAIAAFVVSIIVLFMMYVRYRWVFLIFSIPLLSIFVLSGLSDDIVFYYMRGQPPEQFFTLSSRLVYWQSSLSYIISSLKRLLVGYGAYTGGRFLITRFFEFYDIAFSSTHNTWVEVALGVGVIGLIPLIVAVSKVWMILVRSWMLYIKNTYSLDAILTREALCVLVILTVRSMFQVVFIWHPALEWLLILGYAEFLRRKYANRVCPQPLHSARR